MNAIKQLNNFSENTTKRKSFLTVLFFLFIAIIMTLTVSAQERIVSGNGTKAELDGVGRIYVETGKDSKAREQIIKEIRRQVPYLNIVNVKEEADVTLIYRNESLQVEDNRQTEAPRQFVDNKDRFYRTVSFQRETVKEPVTIPVGSGYVLKNNEDETARLLLNFQSERLSNNFDRNPAKTFAQTFARAYLEANKRRNIW